MKKLFTAILFVCMSIAATAQTVIYTAEDTTLYYRIWSRTHGNMLPAAQYMLDTPYVPGTLEQNPSETLTVNLRQVDCTTLVEQVLAIHASNGTFADFCRQLQRLRYADGKVEGYASRLHYFTAWIDNATQIGLLHDVTDSIGGIATRMHINFMTTHPDFYPALADSAALRSIAQQEQLLSQWERHYVPKEQLAVAADRIRDGDILALTTATEGLDITHVGIACHDMNGELRMLHASSARKRVTFTNTLAEYLDNNPDFTGIMVLRVR